MSHDATDPQPESASYLRDADLEARIANSAWTRARLILEAEPELGATQLVERLRQQADSARREASTDPAEADASLT